LKSSPIPQNISSSKRKATHEPLSPGKRIHSLHSLDDFDWHANEGFCEDLARQNVVARLSQLYLRFRRRHIWVSVIAGVS